jgi:hypothetical protein
VVLAVLFPPRVVSIPLLLVRDPPPDVARDLIKRRKLLWHTVVEL